MRDLWNNIEKWIQIKPNIFISIDANNKTIGYYNYDEHFCALNFVLVNSKYYIYRSAKKIALNIFSLQRIIANNFMNKST